MRTFRTAFAGVPCAMMCAGLCACGLTQMDVTLATQTFMQEFSTGQTGTLPSVACSAQLNFCAAGAGIINDPRVTLRCDTTKMVCVGDVAVNLPYSVDFSNDIAFKTGIAQGDADSIRNITLRYTIDDTFNFDIAEVGVYLGPKGAVRKTDAGVVMAGTLPPLKRMQGVPDSAMAQLVIQDGTPAHDQLVNDIKNPNQPFDFILSTSTLLQPGDPIPAGKIVVQLTPVLTLLHR